MYSWAFTEKDSDACSLLKLGSVRPQKSCVEEVIWGGLWNPERVFRSLCATCAHAHR